MGLDYADSIPGKRVRPPLPQGVSWVWHETASNGEAWFLEFLEMLTVPSLPLLPDSLWPWVVVLVRFPSIAQIDLFKNLFYLIALYAKKKPFKK